jgi:hypothetical protein
MWCTTSPSTSVLCRARLLAKPSHCIVSPDANTNCSPAVRPHSTVQNNVAVSLTAPPTVNGPFSTQSATTATCDLVPSAPIGCQLLGLIPHTLAVCAASVAAA